MSVSKRLRFLVLRRDKYRCFYCGACAPMARLEVDHRVPRCNGGEDIAENLVAACYACNRGKGPLDETSGEWTEQEKLEAAGYYSWEDLTEDEAYCNWLILRDEIPSCLAGPRLRFHINLKFDILAAARETPSPAQSEWDRIISVAMISAFSNAFDGGEDFPWLT